MKDEFLRFLLFNFLDKSHNSNKDTLKDFLNLRDCQYLFYQCDNLMEVPEMDTSSATNMKQMFFGCTNLVSVPNMDTSKVTDMSTMFSKCENLVSIKGLDLSSVTKTTSMFSFCTKLKELTLIRIPVPIKLDECNLLSVDSLVNTIQQLITSSSSKILTIGSTNLEKIAGLYCKIINNSSDIKPMTLCNSSDSGAMSLIEYASKKNWQVK